MNYFTADINFLHHSLGATAPDIFPDRLSNQQKQQKQNGTNTTKKELNGTSLTSHDYQFLSTTESKKPHESITGTKQSRNSTTEPQNKKVSQKRRPKPEQNDKKLLSELTKKIQVKTELSERLKEQVEIERLQSDVTIILLFEYTRSIEEEGRIRVNAKDKLLQRKQRDVEWLKQSLSAKSVQSQTKDTLLQTKQSQIESLIREKTCMENDLKTESEEKDRLIITKECEIATLRNKLSLKKHVTADTEAKYGMYTLEYY